MQLFDYILISNDIVYLCIVYLKAFVVGNNLYYQDTPYDTTVQLTTTGVEKVLFNGVPDWLYEGDQLGFFTYPKIDICNYNCK